MVFKNTKRSLGVGNTTRGLEAGGNLAIPRQIQNALSVIETILALAVKTELFAENYRNTIKAKLNFIAASIRVYVDEEKKTLTDTEKADFQILLKNVKALTSEVVIATSAKPLRAKVQALGVEIKDLF